MLDEPVSGHGDTGQQDGGGDDRAKSAVGGRLPRECCVLEEYPEGEGSRGRFQEHDAREAP